MNQPIIRAQNVVKTFPLAQAPLTLFRQIERRVRQPRDQPLLYALCDLNFEIERGEWVGIIGNNGAGKTTLLKLIAKLYPPTRGTLEVHGSVSLLSGLGVGMMDELTVRENIFLYGAIYSIPAARLRAQFEEIIAWAELQEFTRAKFQTLSSGMRSRLAFSVSRYSESAIQLQDEALTAGDKDFTVKCYHFYDKMRHSGRTFLMASHSLDFVERFCTRTLWLAKGRQIAYGETSEVVAQYRQTHG